MSSQDRVVLTAELKDELSAPLSRIESTVEKTTKTVERANRRQATATTTATAQIDRQIARQRSIFGRLPGVFGKAQDAAGRMFSGTASAVTKHLKTAADAAKTKGEEIGENLDKGLNSKLPKLSGTAKRVGGLIFGFLTGAFAAGGISRALNIEDAQAKLKGLGHDAETITTIMGNASASVKGTAFGLGDAATVAAGAVAAGVQPGKDLERVLRLTGDAATIAGKDLGEMGSIFNKVAASGKIQGDVIAQLQDAGVPILQFMAAELGKTAAEVTDLASAGEIGFDVFTRAMEKGLGGAALASGDTFRGSMKNLMAAFSRISETALTPFLGLVKDGANALIPLLDGVNAKLKPIMAGIVGGIERLKGALASGGTTQDIAAALGFNPAAAQMIADVVGPARAFISTLVSGSTDLTSSGFAGFLEGVAIGINNLVAGLTLAKPDVESLNGDLEGMVLVGVKVREFFDGLLEAVGPLLPQFGELALALSPAALIFAALLPVLPSLIETATALAGALGGILGGALAVLTPILSGVLGFVADLLTRITETEGGTAALVGVILTVTGAILAYKGAVAATSAIMRIHAAITGTVRALKAGFAAASYGAAAASYVEGRAAKAGSVAYYAKAAAVKVATGAAKLFNLALKANPIVKVVSLIALLVGGLVWFFTQTETGRAIVTAAWDGIKVAIAAVVDWWNGTLIPALQSVGQWFADVWQGAKDAVGTAIDWIKEKAAMIGSWFASTFGPAISAIGDVFSAVFGWISRLVENAVLIVMAVAKILGDWFASTFGPAISWIGDLFATVWGGIVWAVQTYILLIQHYIGMLVTFWQTILWPALQAVGDFFVMIWGGITTAAQWAVGLIVAGVGHLVDFWNSHLLPALQWVGSLFATIWGGIVAVIQWTVGLVQGAIQGLVDFWNGTLSPAISAVAGFFSEKLSNAIGGVTGFIDKVVTGFQIFVAYIRDKVQPIIDTISGAFSKLGEIVGGAVQGIKDFAANPLGGAGEWAKGVLGIDNSGGGVYLSGGGVMTPGTFSGGGVAQFAGGGVLGGYAPGRDTIPAILSKGEAVLVPELVRTIGPQNIMAANAAASGGRPAGGGPSLLSGHSGGADAVSLALTPASGGYAPVSAPSRPLATLDGPGGTKIVVDIEKIEVNVGGAGGDGGTSPEDIAEAVEEAVEKAIEKAFNKARKRDY